MPNTSPPDATRPPPEFAPLSSIIVPEERQRREFDPTHLAELGNSIRSRGLFNAILVRQDGVTLVAGECRLRVLRDQLRGIGAKYMYGIWEVPAWHVPIIRVSSDDPLGLEEIELDENIRRRDLTWQELATTTERLKRLRTAQILVDHHPISAITNASLAEEVRGVSTPAAVEATRVELIVARHLDDPEVAKAPTLKDAMKVLQRKDTARKMMDLGALVGKTFSAELHQVLNVDCLEWMRTEVHKPDGARFDVICTDPPYGMGAHEFGDGAGRLEGIEHEYDDSYEAWRTLMLGQYVGPDQDNTVWMGGWCNLSYHIAKPEAHAYVFCDFDRFHELKAWMQSAGWYVFRTPLINVKRNSGRVPLPDQGPRRQYEICLYAIKGKKRTNAIFSDVITTDADEQMSHGAQKPVALYLDLLKRSVKPGDTVLDAFGGTGPLLPAANELKCVATVLEKNPTYYGISVERAQGLTKQGEMKL